MFLLLASHKSLIEFLNSVHMVAVLNLLLSLWWRSCCIYVYSSKYMVVVLNHFFFLHCTIGLSIWCNGFFLLFILHLWWRSCYICLQCNGVVEYCLLYLFVYVCGKSFFFFVFFFSFCICDEEKPDIHDPMFYFHFTFKSIIVSSQSFFIVYF